ncbi:MAG: ATP-grasp domain-containing protein [Massilia sp.]
MHWVIQQSIFKPGNYQLLVDALDAQGIAHTSVSIKNGSYEMSPDLALDGKVYVCGAIRLAHIARSKAWVPGSFLNENFDFAVWLAALGDEMLNARYVAGTLAEVAVPAAAPFFIRPAQDNKAFDGMVMDAEMLASWRQDAGRAHLLPLAVIVSPVRQLFREYRLFVVGKQVVTGSLYKAGGRPQISSDVEDYVLDYARALIARWTPADAFVVDLGLTEDGLKVIEFNNINSSGFYASNVASYVQAIQARYA